jgi:hypothetical protein
VDDQNIVQIERLRLLSDYITDLRDLQAIEAETYSENKLDPF